MSQPPTDPPSIRTIGALTAAAKANLSDGAWAYGSAGAGEEVTVARNRQAWRHLGFVPSVLRDVRDVDVSTRFLGLDLALPVLCSPVGSLTVFHPDGALAAARGAEGAGTVAMTGTLSSPAFPEVQAGSGGNNLFQIYVSGDEVWLDRLVERVTEAGASGLCVTIDSPVSARRDRLLDGAFDWRTEREGVPPNLEGLGRQREFQKHFTLEDFARLRTSTELPLLVKGIMTAADARRVVDAGADVVYVSNHGGRELDHNRSSIEALPDVIAEIGDDAEVILDSGVRHGSDIAKAIALGARAVLIGRLQCWGLAVGGADGVRLVLDILRDELETTLALIGVTSLDELTPDHVCETLPV